MKATGFTKEFDGRIINARFWENVGEYEQKAQSPEEILRLVEYLDNGEMVFGITLAIKIGDGYVPYCLRSDGEWIWPGHLSELVRNRDIGLNESFLEHIRSRHYKVENVSSPRLRHDAEKFIIDSQMLK